MARITKVIQLIVGKDDDLIAYFDALPEGQGQQILKQVLRAGFEALSGSSENTAPVSQPNVTPRSNGSDNNLTTELLQKLISITEGGFRNLNSALIAALENGIRSDGDMPIPKIEEPDHLYDDIMSGLNDWGNQ